MTLKKKIGVALGITLGFVVLVVLSAIVLLNTDAAHRYILSVVIKEVQAATSAHVDIANLSFHRTRLGADFSRFTIRSPQSNSGSPLFSADRVGIDIGLHLFHSPKIAVEDVTLDHPVIHLLIDSHGNSNLPHANASPSGSSTSIFDLAIGHFVLNRGELFYNDKRMPITADIHDLNARAAYQDLKSSYDAMLSYRNGQVLYGSFAPFTHDLELALTAGTSGIVLKSIVIRSGESSLQAQGALTNYEAPSFEGAYQASLSTKDLMKNGANSLNSSGQTIIGLIDTNGTLTYRNSADPAAIDNLSVTGTFRSPSVKFESADIRGSVENLAGDFGLKNGVLECHKIDADTMGGHVTARLVISQLADRAAAQFNATVQDIAVPAVREALRAQELPGIRMDGKIQGNVQAKWHGSFIDLQVVSNAQLAGTVNSASVGTTHSGSFPFNGAAQVSYDGPQEIVGVQNGLLTTPHSRLAIYGSLGNKSSVNVEARSEDLQEVDLLMNLFQTGAAASVKEPHAEPQLLGLGGMAGFTGTVNGTLLNPHFSGTMTATNLRVHNANVQFLKANIEASPRGVAIRQGDLRNGPQARASFDVSIGLRDWSFTPDQPVELRLNAENVSVADLEHMVGFQYPVSGLLNTNIKVTGTEENPEIQGTIQLAQANLWQQPIQSLNIAVRNSGSRLSATVNAKSAAGSTTGTIGFDTRSREYDLQANLADIRLNQVQYLQEHVPQLAGVIRVSANGHGSIAAPQFTVNVNAEQLQLGDQKLDGFQAQAAVTQRQANFNVACNISGAALRSQGSVNLTGDYQTTANVDSQAIQLGPLLQTFLPQAGSDLQGQTEFHAKLKGPLKDPDQLEGQVELPSLKFSYPSLQFAATAPIHIDYQRGVVTVERTEFKGTGTDVTIQVSLPLQQAANLRATADGKVDLQLLQIWNPQLRSSGQLNLQVGVQGTRSHPEMNGTVAIADGAISMDNVPTLEKVKGELNVTTDAIQIKTLTGKMGGGDFEVHGSATYRPGVRFNLGMTTKDVRLLYPDGVRTQLTAALNWIGDPANSNLTGQVTLDRLSLTQSFDLSSLSNEFGGSLQPTTGFAQNVKLNIALNSRQDLELASNQLNIQGTANLQVRGTLAEPVLIGRTNLTGGEFFFNGRRFTVQNASIQFANPVRTAPVVNLTATTVVNQFNLTVNLVGPFDRLRTTYTSDPPLAPVDVINLLITGQTTEAAQNNTTTPQSVLAGQLAGQVSDRLQKLTGISSLTIDPQIGGNQGNGASQLAIQERVTKNLFFTFATDVTTTQGEVVQVEYQITKKYSMSAIRDQTGGYEVEIKSHKTF